jgi:tetratricopeptide (TPR) repeat protein
VSGILDYPGIEASKDMSDAGKFWLLILPWIASSPLQAAVQPAAWQEPREAAQAQPGHQKVDLSTPAQHLERALALARNEGASPASIGELMDRLAWEYRIEERKDGKEEELLLETLRYKSRELGENAPELVPTLMLLNGLRFSQQQYLEAFQLIARVITIQARNFGPESAEVAQGYTHLGLSYQAAGDLKQAEHYLRRAVEILRKTPNPPDEVLSGSLASLAELLRKTDRTDEAEALNRELEPVFARLAEQEREEARGHEDLPRDSPASDVEVLSPEETAAALAAAAAALAQMAPPPR